MSVMYTILCVHRCLSGFVYLSACDEPMVEGKYIHNARRLVDARRVIADVINLAAARQHGGER